MHTLQPGTFTSPVAPLDPIGLEAKRAPTVTPRPGGDGAAERTGLVEIPACIPTVLQQVPDHLTGSERLAAIAAAVARLSNADRQALREAWEPAVTRMLDLGASDLDAGGPAANGLVWYRVGGDKAPRAEVGTFSIDVTDALFLGLLNDRQLKVLFERFAIDFSYELPFAGRDGRPRRFRGTMYFDLDHIGLNLRMITDEVRALRTLEFHPAIERALMFRYERDGLTLVTGVTGSGKSSTLDAVIDANNVDAHAHVVVIGQPVEYMHESKKCLVRHREVGKDVRTFKEGIVQALRQDPDIVVIGEMRDPETISAALEITDSGHKVFSTLHTSSAIESIDRIIGEYPPDEQERICNRLGDVLRCVVSQKLCPRVGGGRVLAKEVLWVTPPARAAIKNKNHSEIYQMMWESGQQGMVTMEQDLFRLVRMRLITPETAYSYANNKRRLQQLMG